VLHYNSIFLSYFLNVLDVRRVIDIRQIEIYTAETLVPDPSSLEVELLLKW
jgi:hypothetical protein